MSQKRKRKKKRGASAPAKAEEVTSTVTSPQPEAGAAEPANAAPATSSTASSTDTPDQRVRSLHGVVACRLVVVVAGHIGFLALVLYVAALASPKARLTGFDLAALPAEPVKLHAKFELAGPGLFNPITEGVSLDFLEIGVRDALPGPEEGTLVDSALTGSDGSATLAITAPEIPGNYFYRVAATDPTQVPLVSPNAFLVVSVAPAERPVIISDIDNTLCKTQLTETALLNPQDVAPLKGAQAVLSEQSSNHLIVYLSVRPTRLVAGTRSWLAAHGFPVGPLFFRDVSDASSAGYRDSDYKAAFIHTTITSRWKNVPWGIGTVEADAQAYLTNDIQPILVDPQDARPDSAAGAILRAANWNEIRELLKRETP